MFFLCFSVFLRVCLLCLCFYVCLFDCKCKSLKRLGENRKNKKKHKKNIKTQRKTEKQKNQKSPSRNLRYLFAVGSRINYLFKTIPYYRSKTLSILYNEIPYYIRKPLPIEGTPSLTIERNPLL